jgi:hypothetical protein
MGGDEGMRSCAQGAILTEWLADLEVFSASVLCPPGIRGVVFFVGG